MAVPVDQELVLGVSADRGDRQQAGIQITGIVEPWSARHFGEKEGTTELVALRVQKLHRHRIEISHPRGKAIREKGFDQGGLVARVREHRDGGVDQRSRRAASALARALIIQVEVPKLRLPANRSASVCPEDVLLYPRPGFAGLVEEEVIGIQGGVAKKLPGIEMVFVCPSFQHGVDVAAAIAALRGVIEAGGDLECLDGVGIGDWGAVELSTSRIGGKDSF